MSDLHSLDVKKAAEAVYERYAPKLDRLSQDEVVRLENQNILFEFSKIAIEMLKSEESLPIPNQDTGPTETTDKKNILQSMGLFKKEESLPEQKTIPMDKALLKKLAFMFAEGTCFAISRLASRNIKGDIKTRLLQNAAMDIYSECKRLAVETEMDKTEIREALFKKITKQLKFYIEDYEKQNGPIPGRLESKLEARS